MRWFSFCRCPCNTNRCPLLLDKVVEHTLSKKFKMRTVPTFGKNLALFEGIDLTTHHIVAWRYMFRHSKIYVWNEILIIDVQYAGMNEWLFNFSNFQSSQNWVGDQRLGRPKGRRASERIESSWSEPSEPPAPAIPSPQWKAFFASVAGVSTHYYWIVKVECTTFVCTIYMCDYLIPWTVYATEKFPTIPYYMLYVSNRKYQMVTCVTSLHLPPVTFYNQILRLVDKEKKCKNTWPNHHLLLQLLPDGWRNTRLKINSKQLFMVRMCVWCRGSSTCCPPNVQWTTDWQARESRQR